MENNLYIVLSQTNTKMGFTIRAVTGYEYNHVAIALNPKLQPLYSFARYHVNAPFVGGFVEESWLRYLYGKKDLKIKIFKIEMPPGNYRHIERVVREFVEQKQRYQYDFRSALGCKRRRGGIMPRTPIHVLLLSRKS